MYKKTSFIMLYIDISTAVIYSYALYQVEWILPESITRDAEAKDPEIFTI